MTFLKKKNNARSFLNASISDSDLSIIVANASLFPVSGDFLLTIWDRTLNPDPTDDTTMEIVKVVSVSGNTFTIQRAQEGTIAQAHNLNDTVALLFTSGTIEEIEDVVNSHLADTDNPHATIASQVPTDNTGETVQSKLDSLDSDITSKQNSLGFTPENVSNKSTNTSLGTSDTLYPSQKAVKTYVDTSLSGKEATLGFTPENISNKDTDGTLATNSDVKYPSQKAVKTYIDTGLSAKQNSISIGTSLQYFRGDLSLATFPTNLSSFSNDSGYLTSIVVNAPLSGSGTSASHLSISLATTSTNGYLSSTDWNTFNNKETAGIDLRLDQTSAQHIINGSPHFDAGIIIKAGQKLYFDGA